MCAYPSDNGTTEGLPKHKHLPGRSSSLLPPRHGWSPQPLSPLNPPPQHDGHRVSDAPGQYPLPAPTLDMMSDLRFQENGPYHPQRPPEAISSPSLIPDYELPHSHSFLSPSGTYGDLDFPLPANGFSTIDQSFPTSTVHSNATSPDSTAREFTYVQSLSGDTNFPYDPGTRNSQNLSTLQYITNAVPSSLPMIDSGFQNGDISAHGRSFAWPSSSQEAFSSSQYVTTDISLYESPALYNAGIESCALHGSCGTNQFSLCQIHDSNILTGIGSEMISTSVSMIALFCGS
jgi:hypothetical protein